ncbi:hypothetical protein OVN18_05270 [Microcella daejeonensis]|uniref:DUF202 domain-containing protein n=1 Tax=Microcella daejeonensis TaxID=2994971 RepID=A0A9E8S988_9MICO|nr:hypothetical protein [Microcella daejeonensis]WAB82415.1 hypothetical protein OVN18_05270 [Microcella daejeonensis]
MTDGATAGEPSAGAGAGAGAAPAGRPRVGRAPVDRTSLAWQRTSATAALVALFAAVTAVRLGEPAVGIAATVLALVGLIVGATTPRVHRSTADRRDPWPVIVRAAVVLALSAVVGIMLAIAALAGG